MNIGKRGEDAAALLLEKFNFKVLYRNWRCSEGELDLIAIKQKILTVVEVKTRQIDIAEGFSPFMAVDPHKAAQIKKITDRFLFEEKLKLKRYQIRSIRFDVIGVFYRHENGKLKMSLKHLPNAFDY